ncbi:MAG: cysteine desulfurase, partial [Candidatus Bathyarchaeota archaeon]
MDANRIRRDFPILATGITYLDSAASSLTPEPVLDKMSEFYHQYRANVERSVHQLSQRASEEYEKARLKVSAFINSKSDREVVMTKNTTEGINTVASGLKWQKGDNIVTTNIEHHSNFIVWLRAKDRYGIDVRIVKPNKEGLFELADFERTIDDRTKLVAVTHASNVLGVITPVNEITEIAHKSGACMLIDGAQSVPHMKVDVQKIGCDFLAFSGHKMCGPTGIGILYIREDLLDEVEPLSIGGGTIEDVGFDYYRLAKGPKRFEAGTPPIAEAIGLGAAIDYLRSIGMDNIREHDMKLIGKMHDEINKISKVTVYGPEPKNKVGILSFNIEGLSPHDVALALDATARIMVRSGAHCTLPLMKGVICQPAGTVRASTYLYNTSEEVDKLMEAISKLSASQI